ncbi:imidazole glycerol phosphate synthase subunit HisH [Salisaeta longa]|uniref:imidazole glycerol phosphate synthase subunit HisH n=1 Tax=Salisaeta longa TaxID=503170 RepID=UPI0003B74105|nr:imidazole glycerol phosphate synthase subunit HisH [Salisaeta longa]
MVTIIDYGIGNLRSIEKALERVGASVTRTDDPAAIAAADRLVLPGVGAFGACADAIRSRGLEAPLQEAVGRGTPLLGVCVGMQLLFDVGLEHGTHEGLGLLPGRVVHFHKAPAGEADALKVPHMGWNQLAIRRATPLTRDLGDAPYVYFVHSYHAVADSPRDVVATATYGHAFPAIVQRDNVYGVQFHPEKSQLPGLRILQNFATLAPVPA